MRANTQYAKNGDVHIAYQVVGDGPFDLVFVPGWVSHLELMWGWGAYERFMARLSSFCRLILFDKRGTGLSDPVAEPPTLEDRMNDLRAVMDAAGSERPAILGLSEGGPTAVLFAATHPSRARALVLYGSQGRMFTEPGDPPEMVASLENAWERIYDILEHWGEGRTLGFFAPSIAQDRASLLMAGNFERASASPGLARALIESYRLISVREAARTLEVPTLVMHRMGDPTRLVNRELHQLIRGSRLVELEGVDHLPWVGDQEPVLGEIEEFLTGARAAEPPRRALATVVFTDIVDSTRQAAQMGDARWHEQLEAHDAFVRQMLHRFQGREVKTMGDGFLATFDGPARAIACARGIVAEVNELGLQVRAGLHTGECEMSGGDVHGLAVNIAARVAALAEPGEVLVSRTVQDLVAGSGLLFEPRGAHELKGVPGRWEVLRVAGTGARRVDLQREPPRPTERAQVFLTRRAPSLTRRLGKVFLRER